MPTSVWLRLLLSVAVVAVVACDPPEEVSNQPVGYSDPSSEPPPGVLRPVSPEEPEQVVERGRLLVEMERALEMGLQHGLPAAGNVREEIILPVADIDPGGLSGQVVFFRWRNEDVPDAADLDPTRAERYLLVSVMLKPDRVVDLEKLQGYVEPRSREYYRIAAILAATRKLQSVARGHRFRFHPLIEEVPLVQGERAKIKLQTRVYAMGAEENDPDYELVVLGPQRFKDAEVLTTTEVHRKAARAEAWIRTALPYITPLTVARVIARGGAAETLEVQTTRGTQRLSTRTGLKAAGDGG